MLTRIRSAHLTPSLALKLNTLVEISALPFTLEWLIQKETKEQLYFFTNIHNALVVIEVMEIGEKKGLYIWGIVNDGKGLREIHTDIEKLAAEIKANFILALAVNEKFGEIAKDVWGFSPIGMNYMKEL